MGLLLLYLIGALSISFLCSILEAVLLSVPMSFVSMLEKENRPGAALLKKYKQDIDKPIAAILSLNTISHTVGAAGVGAQSAEVFGSDFFALTSAILTLLILVFSEIIPKPSVLPIGDQWPFLVRELSTHWLLSHIRSYSWRSWLLTCFQVRSSRLL